MKSSLCRDVSVRGILGAHPDGIIARLRGREVAMSVCYGSSVKVSAPFPYITFQITLPERGSIVSRGQ